MKTSRVLVAGAVAIALIAAFGSSAVAATITITANDGYRTGVGGEFTVTPNDGPAVGALANYSPLAKVDPSGSVGWGFQSFCLEYTEHFNPGSTYDYVISPGASFGGPGGNGLFDPISRGTAWLYSQFARGTLAGYDYTPGVGRNASAGALQNAIWWLENEITLSNPTANPFLDAAIDFYGLEVRSDAFADQGVAALNLTYTDNRGNVINRQDQLILVPDGGMTVVLLGMVLTGLGLMRRKLS